MEVNFATARADLQLTQEFVNCTHVQQSSEINIELHKFNCLTVSIGAVSLFSPESLLFPEMFILQINCLCRTVKRFYFVLKQ